LPAGSIKQPRTGWALRRDGVIAPGQRLTPGQTIAFALKHVVAMFGATLVALNGRPSLGIIRAPRRTD
jgi:hypothetical protein